MMREKYIKFFKKELIFLLILLVIVCFSFGLTYSNFIYSSDEFRAVEMFTSKLNYELSENKIIVNSGNNLIKLNIKSLNSVDSFFKIIYDNENVSINYFNIETNIIKANQSISVYLIIFNRSNKSETVNLETIGGFITNKYEDIKVNNDYYEVNNNIEIGEIVVLENQAYRLLNINNDGSYELLSEISQNELNIEGSHGYNQYIGLINDNITLGRALTLEDIERYTNNKLITYDNSHTYISTYYPYLWSFEEGSIINYNAMDNIYNRSEGIENGNYEYAPSITVNDIKLNNISFINETYRAIFLNSNYLIATRYNKCNDENAEWGVLSIRDGNIKLNKLFESNVKDYVVNGNIRIIVNIPSNTDLFSKAL